VNTNNRRALTLAEIEQHETGKWVYAQLDRLEELVKENGADEEMLGVIEFLREENDRWADPYIEKLDRAGVLALPDGHASAH